jgi:flavin reductase (DIM6/NTAB) family NADH-FMN oxidoreductase RutF
VSEEFAEKMNLCAGEYPASVDEFKLSGLTPAPSEVVQPPRVQESHVNMECRLYQILDFRTHDIFIGEIVSSYCDEEAMTDDKVDLEKVKPMLFDMHLKQYWRLGEPFAKCWDIGKQLKK